MLLVKRAVGEQRAASKKYTAGRKCAARKNALLMQIVLLIGYAANRRAVGRRHAERLLEFLSLAEQEIVSRRGR